MKQIEKENDYFVPVGCNSARNFLFSIKIHLPIYHLLPFHIVKQVTIVRLIMQQFFSCTVVISLLLSIRN